MKIGFVTCGNLSRFFPSNDNPLFTHDDFALVQYLSQHDIMVDPVVWGCDVKKLHDHNISTLVVRSPWDYSWSADNTARFFAWLNTISDQGITLINDPALMKWNLDKRYLSFLASHGTSILPTTYVEPNETLDYMQALKNHGAFILKPAIGAGAKDLTRIQSPSDINREQLDTLRCGRTFLLQPYCGDIMSLGEWSLIYFNGHYSHAVHKRPGRGQWLVQDELGGSVESGEPSADIMATAKLAIDALPHAFSSSTKRSFVKPLYARVDIISQDGENFVSELELVEPELFFLSRIKGAVVENQSALASFHQGLLRHLFDNTDSNC